MLTKRPEFPYESLEAFKELKKGHHGGKNRAQKIGGATAAAVAAPAAIGAAGYAAAGIAAKSCASSVVSSEAIVAGAAGSIAAGIVLPIFVTGVLVAAGVACAAVIALKSSKTRDYAQVGNYSSIAHGNVVALHSERHNRFIRLYKGRVNGRGGRKDIDKFPEKWGSEEFLVVQRAEWTFAFYSVSHGQYICMNKKRTMTGIDSKAQVDDENVDEHEFIVRDEGNGKISLLSIRHDCFVRMDDKGNIDGNAVAAREWEHFNVVLLLKNPFSTD